jgi:hypothetical protein
VVDLTVGDSLRGQAGQSLTVVDITRDPGVQRVYNLTVESDHVYFVGDLTTLTHNTCPVGEVYSIRIDPRVPGRPDPRFSIDTAGFGGIETPAGGYRNAAKFWEQWAELRPETISPANRWRIDQLKLNPRGPSPRIDDTWIAHFPEHSAFPKDVLIHHHVGQGPIAIPLPGQAHRGFGAVWHER